MQLYRPMLKQALRITWRNKFLWFFGLFAVLFGNGGAYNLGFSNLKKVESQGMWLNNIKTMTQNWSLKFNAIDLNNLWSSVSISGFFLVLIIFIVAVFFVWLAVVSQGALIHGATEKIREKESKFNEVFKYGITKFWAVLLLDVIFNVILFVILVLLSLPFFILFMSAVGSVLWQSILIVLSFIVWVPLAIMFSIIIKYALIYSINENKHISEALSSALTLFAKNWIVSLETGFILFLLNLITGLLLGVVLIFIALPFIILALIAVQLASNGFLWLVITLGLLTFIALVFWYGAFWNVFSTTTWIILFEKINEGTVYSKILRWANIFASDKKRESNED